MSLIPVLNGTDMTCMLYY